MKLEHIRATGRADFNATWLGASPSWTPGFDAFGQLSEQLTTLIEHEPKAVVAVTSEFKYFDNNSQLRYYWLEQDGVVQLITEAEVKPQAVIINFTGKRASVRGQAPWAADLYVKILKQTGKNLKFVFSDKTLTDDGFDVWRRLLANGFKISLYDVRSPGASYELIKDEAELKSYFGPGKSNYRFILSESMAHTGLISGHFNTRRLREQFSLDVSDD